MMASTSYRHFKVSVPQEFVTHVEINRVDKVNVFTEDMWMELRQVFDDLSEDDSVRAIVLSGAGERGFSTGLDLAAALSPGSLFNPRPEGIADGARYAARVRKFAVRAQDCVTSIERCEKLCSAVICVLHGITVGLAVDIATCADLRLCTSDVTFSVKEVDAGLAADVSTLTRLPKIVGSAFGADEALRVGFANSIWPTKAAAFHEALRIAVAIASKSPVAVQGTKNFLDWCRDHDIATGLRYTAVWNGGALNTKDIPHSIRAIQVLYTE
ncbi:uncharacterized protein A1O5_05208 [Cladophialophora psammophila CBS 110553]|uniref:Enoyl-CoA hydratase n=1 Tax=Cladophialophora psammophila CBS 110553 TaxID=1182543 RepID=W9X3B2_9EURO|nr:uncharacterized protein A1O5_05208 [Cladophialophora psammophila CBS 110553]EXJ71401.1 hypothetical protein A1O5_05208 [Cladophialophora psammophila CBS 110553]